MMRVHDAECESSSKSCVVVLTDDGVSGVKGATAARPDIDTSCDYASVSACCFLSVATAQLSVPVQVAGSAPSQRRPSQQEPWLLQLPG